MSVLGTMDVLVRAKTGKFNKDIDAAEAKTQRFGKSAVSSLGSVTASFASLAGVAGVGGLAIAMVKSGANFESQMATVRGVMRATADDYDLLEAAARKMGETTEWTATQSAEALNYMGLAGWSVQKSIAGLPGMLSAATAAGVGLGETSDIITDTLTAMGLEIEDVGRLTDVMVGTTTRANTDFRQMGEAMEEAAPYAKAYGFEIEAVSAQMGVIADAGIKGSNAGIGLKNTWINNAKAAKELGTEATDLIGTLRAANEAQWDTNKYAEVYGKIAGKTVLNLAANIDKYEALTDTLHDVAGETQKLADIKLDTLTGDFKLLQSTVEGLAMAVSGDTNSSLRASVQDLTATIRDNKDTIVGLFTGIVTAGTKAIDIVSQLTRSVSLLGVVAASSDKSFWDWMVLDDAGAKQWQQEIKDGTSFLKDQLHDVRESIDKLDYELDWGAGELTENQQAALDGLKAQEAQILESIKKIQEAKNKVPIANYNSDSYQKIFGTMPATKLPTISTGDTEKKAAAIAKAYQSAYASLDSMTQATYDAMASKYQQDYDDFVKITGDKVTAQAVLNEKMAALNKKMLGVDTGNVTDEIAEKIKRQTEAIDHQIEYIKLQAETFGMSAAQSDLYRMGIDGATESQIALAGSYYKIINAKKDAAAIEDEGLQVTASMRTEAEKFGDELERMDDLLGATAISQETYNRVASEALSGAFGAFDGDSIDGLNTWYSDQLSRLEEYRQARSEMNETWDAKELELKQQYEISRAAIENQSYALALSTTSTMFGEMAGLASTYAGEQSDTYRALFAVSKAFAIAEASIKLWQAIANAGASTTWPANIAAMASVASAMGGLVSNIASVGMAHDGIDSVPTSGTWLLEKGERVTTNQTSAKLDDTLSAVQAQLAGGGNSAGSTTVQSSPKIVNVWDESMISDHINSGKADSIIINRIKKNASTIKNFL